MKLEITKVKENPLMDRREVKAEVKHEGDATPSEEDVLGRIAADIGLDQDNVEVNHIYTNYGDNDSEAFIHIYEEFEYSENLETSSLDRVDDSPSSDEELEEETIASQEDTQQASTEYTEIVSGTITEAKEALNEMGSPDFESALEAEKSNKNRTTLVDWLEDQIEG